MAKICSPVVGPWYRWIVLVATCLTQTFCAGYTNSTMSFMSIYYAERFSDRKVAGVITTLQGGILCLAALPAIFLVKRFGERVAQVGGGFLTIIGVVITAFATEGWHALLGTGIIGGIGCAISLASPYEILSKYFPGKQLVPYACMSLSYTIGILVFPQIVAAMMNQLGYTYTLLGCCGFLFVNMCAGFLFLPKDLVAIDDDDDSAVAPKFILKLRGRKSGVFHVPQLAEAVPPIPGHYVKLNEKEIEKRGLEAFEEIQQQRQDAECDADSAISIDGSTAACEASESKDKLTELPNITHLLALATIGAMTNPSSECLKPKNPGLNLLKKQNSSLSKVIVRLTEMSAASMESGPIESEVTLEECSKAKASLARADSEKSIKTMITDSYGLTIGELLDDTRLAKKSLKDLFKNAQVLSYFACSFLITASFFSFGAVLGDFCKNRLHYTNEEFSFGVTMIGIAMIPFGIFYLLMTRFSSFSAAFLHSINLGICGIVMFFMLTDPSPYAFYALMAVYGMCRSFYIGNILPTCMEITNPSLAVLTYMIELVFDGIGGLTLPYLAAYLQVELDMRYGMALAGCFMMGACLVLLPVGIKNLVSPKTYTKFDEVIEKVQQTGHYNIPEEAVLASRLRQQSLSITPMVHM